MACPDCTEASGAAGCHQSTVQRISIAEPATAVIGPSPPLLAITVVPVWALTTHRAVLLLPASPHWPRPCASSILNSMKPVFHSFLYFLLVLPAEACWIQVEREGLPGGYKDVQPGDCVVAFSRNDIYDIKATIESSTGRRCASGTSELHSSGQLPKESLSRFAWPWLGADSGCCSMKPGQHSHCCSTLACTGPMSLHVTGPR